MRLAALAVIASFASISPLAAQSRVTASTTGTFTQAFAGPEDTAPVFSGIGTPGFSFGAGDPSTLYFAGANGDYADTYSPPNPFFLGSIYYHNGTITTTSGITALTLSLRTLLSEPVNPAGDGVGSLDERVYITNTRNSTDMTASADYITFSSLGIGAYVFEGESAIFNLMGTINSPLKLTSIILVSDPSTGFVAPAPTVNTPVTPVGSVPELGTWAMMILGMGAIGFAMRCRQKNVTTTVKFA